MPRQHPDLQALTAEDLCELVKDPIVTPLVRSLALEELMQAPYEEIESIPRGSWHKIPNTVWHQFEAETNRRDREAYIASFNGKFYVNVYEVSRAYGGSEEGGWWYDCGTPVTGVLLDSMEAADAQWELFRAEYPDTGASSSVLGGEDYRVAIQRHPAASYPTERPHYE